MTTTETDESKTTKKFMNDLLDDLLLEILIRLPNCFTAARCSAVCKRWHSLLSNPQFISDFIDRHRRRRSPIPCGFIYQLPPKPSQDSSPPPPPPSPPSNPLLGFLPMPIIGIHSSCNDLFLMRTREFSLVCNPLIKQWNPIPNPPPPPGGHRPGRMWLACHPDRLRYKVVRAPINKINHSSELSVMIFSSDTEEWKTRTVVFPQPLSPVSSDLGGGSDVASSEDGALYWLDRVAAVVKGVASFNPFDDECPAGKLRGRVIAMPQTVEWSVGSYCLGMFKGRVRVATLDVGSGSSFLRIAELGDDLSWCLKHQTRLEDQLGTIRVIGIDPNEGDKVFLLHKDVVSTFKIGNASDEVVKHLGGDPQRASAFPVACPYWPTQLKLSHQIK